jgi:hypothetical protein
MEIYEFYGVPNDELLSKATKSVFLESMKFILIFKVFFPQAA